MFVCEYSISVLKNSFIVQKEMVLAKEQERPCGVDKIYFSLQGKEQIYKF